MQYATEYIHFKLCKNKKLINDKRRYGTYLSTLYEHVLPFADPPLPPSERTYLMDGPDAYVHIHRSCSLASLCGGNCWRIAVTLSPLSLLILAIILLSIICLLRDLYPGHSLCPARLCCSQEVYIARQWSFGK